MTKGKHAGGMLLAFLLCSFQVKLWGQMSISAVNTAVTQNFDGLSNSPGSNFPQTGSVFASGWLFLETGSNANQFYQANTGSDNTGDTYSFGSASTSERAFGVLQSGSLSSVLGFKFTNNTGQTVSSLLVGYTGEVWRLNAAGDQLSFSYQIGDVALNAASGWNTVAGLSFSTPIVGGPAAIDGNNNTSRTVISPLAITGLYIPNGATVTFRWVDATGTNSAAMGIDDFTLTLVPPSTNYFRTKASGSWNTLAAWETSADGLSWSPATTSVPTDMAAGVSVLSGHTIVSDADLNISKLTIQAGGKFTYNNGTLTVKDSPGDDIVLQGTNSVLEVAATNNPILNGSASVRIGTGGVLLLSGNNNLLAYHGASFTYANGAVFEYANAGAPATVAGTFFSAQDAGAIPIFRYNSSNTSPLGNSSATTINGKTEVSAGRTLNLSGVTGTLTLRNGIIGAGDLKAGTALVTGPAAEIGGTGTINTDLIIESTCTATLTSDKFIAKSNGVTVNGTFDLASRQLQNTGTGFTPAFTVNAAGTVKTANADGLVNTGGSLKTSNFAVNFAAGSTVVYNATGAQTITTNGVPAYQNLQIAGTGMKTAQSGSNLIVQGTCIVSNGATMALTGLATENLYLNNNAALQVQSGGTFDNGGESSITSSGGTPSVQISGNFITRDQQGFVGSNTCLPSITPTLNPDCTVEYGRSGDQMVQATITYQNLAFSGGGTKTPTNAISANGTVSITGSTVVDGTTHTIGGNNLVMTGTSRLKVGTTGTVPSMTGTYTLAPTTTIEFLNSNATTQTIRQGGGPGTQYGNVEISGSNVSAPLSGITLQAGTAFTIKSGGALKVTSVNGLYAASNAAVLSDNNPTLSLLDGSTVEYSATTNQSITPGYAYSNLTLSGDGTKTASGSFTVGATLTRSGNASLAGNSPAYLPNATLAYVDATAGRAYTQGLEWPSVNGPTNLTVNLSGGGNAAVKLANDASVTGILTLSAGALHLADKTLSVSGNITGGGTLTGSSLSSLVTGGNSTLSFTQTTDGITNALANLTVTSGTATLQNTLNVYNALTVAGGTLDLNNKSLVLKSLASQTARVAEIKGTLTGETAVTVERFIPASGSNLFRFLTGPVSGASINDAWQEKQVYNGSGNLVTGTNTPVVATAGKGVMISGTASDAAAANAAGFDYWTGVSGMSSASVKRFVPSSEAAPGPAYWKSLESTKTYTFNGARPYMLYVWGDRTKTPAKGTTPSLVLRPKGTLNKGDIAAKVTLYDDYTALGNPYASPLDFLALYNANSSSIKNYFYTWTADNGYVLVLSAGGGNYLTQPAVSPASPANRIIHSGEGFLVAPATTGSGTVDLIFKEAHKSTGSPGVSVFRQADIIKPAYLQVSFSAVQASGKKLLDGALIRYHGSYASGGDNIVKLFNGWEQISLPQGAGHDLAVRSQTLPNAGDTVWLKVSGAEKQKEYLLELASQEFPNTNLAAVLIDRWLRTETPLNLFSSGTATPYRFTLTDDAASKDPLRFAIVFRAAAESPLPLVLSGLKAYQKRSGVAVEWEVSDEQGIKQYNVEKSPDGRQFDWLATVAARGGTGKQAFQAFDPSPVALNYYRIRLVGTAGEVRYSGVVKIEMQAAEIAESVRIYPNPLRNNGTLQLQLINRPPGTYRVRLIGSAGQLLFQKNIQHSGGSCAYPLALGWRPALGNYTLEIKSAKGKTESRKLQVVD